MLDGISWLNVSFNISIGRGASIDWWKDLPLGVEHFFLIIASRSSMGSVSSLSDGTINRVPHTL